MGYGVGPDYAGIVFFRIAGGTLADVPAPHGSFMEASDARELANGGVRWVGFPRVLWHWDFFKMAWYDDLRDLMSGGSGLVAICTTTNDDSDEFAYYWARYTWPLELEKDSHRRMDFDIEFRIVPPGEITPPAEPEVPE